MQSENEQLQQTIGQLRAAQAERAFEQNQLRELTALREPPVPAIAAHRHRADDDEYSSNFTATITLDKGRADGVDVGFPVVGAGGLVGQVIQSFHHTSVVRLVTDGQSKVGVTFGNQLTGIVDGQGPGELHDGRPRAAAHARCTRASACSPAVSTRPRSRPGSPWPRCASFHTAAGASQETITVDPAADLDHLAYVDVVQWVPPT